MTVVDIVTEIEAAGVAFRIDGEKIRVCYPSEERREELAGRIAQLRKHRARVTAFLKKRSAILPMPEGVRLVWWEPKIAPIILTQCSVVTDVPKFIISTLRQLKAAIDGKRWLSGHWSVRELTDRLEQCGVLVQIGDAERGR